ncbi:abcG4, partial [Symbiodinium pilosum]
VMFLLQKESPESLDSMQTQFAKLLKGPDDDEDLTREKSRIIAQGKTAGFCLQLWLLT